MATLLVKRTSSFMDRLRAYSIEVDGKSVGALKAGSTLRTTVDAGRHSIQARIDWCGSPLLHFEAGENEEVTFECGSNLTGWRLLLASFYVSFFSDDYLFLRRAP